VYQFCWGSVGATAQETRLAGYFSLSPHPGKMAFLPVAAVMFRCAGVAAAPTQATLLVPERVPRSGDMDVPRLWTEAGFKTEQMLRQRMAVKFTASGETRLEADEDKGDGPVRWDWSNPKQATFTVNAPATRAAVGFIGGRKVVLGDVSIEMAATERNWASIALAALDAKPIAESSRVLLVAAGGVENTDMGWNDKRTTVGRNWGKAPIIAEGIPATVTLPGRVKVSALDPSGTRKAQVPAAPAADGRIVIKIGPEHATLWYLIER